MAPSAARRVRRTFTLAPPKLVRVFRPSFSTLPLPFSNPGCRSHPTRTYRRSEPIPCQKERTQGRAERAAALAARHVPSAAPTRSLPLRHPARPLPFQFLNHTLFPPEKRLL